MHPTRVGVRVAVRVTPRAARAGIGGVVETEPGHRRLKVLVTEAPDGGRANAAVIKLLAKTWRVPQSGITLVSGAADRNKILEIAGDPAILWARLTTLLPEGNSDD